MPGRQPAATALGDGARRKEPAPQLARGRKPIWSERRWRLGSYEGSCGAAVAARASLAPIWRLESLEVASSAAADIAARVIEDLLADLTRRPAAWRAGKRRADGCRVSDSAAPAKLIGTCGDVVATGCGANVDVSSGQAHASSTTGISNETVSTTCALGFKATGSDAGDGAVAKRTTALLPVETVWPSLQLARALRVIRSPNRNEAPKKELMPL